MPESRIQVGVIGRAHGVRGLVRVTSHTADPAALAAYGPLFDERGRQFTLRWKGEGVAEVSEIVDGVPVKVADRTAAEKLTNVRLFIDRAALPPAEEDEFYLADLIGLAAVDSGGLPLGLVTVVHDYGAGASLEIERPGAPVMIVPFTRACVPVVDIAGGRLTVIAPDEVVVPEAPGESVVPEAPGESVVLEAPGESVVLEAPGESVVLEAPGELSVPHAGDNGPSKGRAAARGSGAGMSSEDAAA